MSSYAAVEAPADRGFTLDVPPKPVPGQIKPDSQGQCRKGQVALNGGCWFELKISQDNCPGNGFIYKGACYSPILPSTREPTSAPLKKP
jgi:eukaryotic-like serine/threonine-protein kinase